MFDLVYGDPVVRWVVERIDDFGPVTGCAGIGFASSGRIVAGAVYNNFRGHDIQLSFAAEDPRWAVKGNIRAVFHYPFEQLKCARVTAFTSKANRRARKLIEGVGFKMEGVHPKGWDGRQTAISYGMCREDCKWLR